MDKYIKRTQRKKDKVVKIQHETNVKFQEL